MSQKNLIISISRDKLQLIEWKCREKSLKYLITDNRIDINNAQSQLQPLITVWIAAIYFGPKIVLLNWFRVQ